MIGIQSIWSKENWIICYREKGFEFAYKLGDEYGNDIYDETYFEIKVEEVSRKWIIN